MAVGWSLFVGRCLAASSPGPLRRGCVCELPLFRDAGGSGLAPLRREGRGAAGTGGSAPRQLVCGRNRCPRESRKASGSWERCCEERRARKEAGVYVPASLLCVHDGRSLKSETPFFSAVVMATIAVMFCSRGLCVGSPFGPQLSP